MNRLVVVGVVGLAASAWMTGDAATYTLVKQAGTPPRAYVWGVSSTWDVAGVPGLTNTADTVVIPAPSGTTAEPPDVIDLNGQTYTLDTLTVSGRDNGYTFTNGTLVVNQVFEGDGSKGKSLFGANLRIAAQGDELVVGAPTDDPDDMWFESVIGDGAGGGGFSLALSSYASRNKYRPWYFYGPSTYFGGTVVSNWARFVTGCDSVTNGLGDIVSGPAGRGPITLTGNGFLSSSTSSRILHNPIILDGDCGFDGGFTLEGSKVSGTVPFLLAADSDIALANDNAANPKSYTFNVNTPISDGGSGYSLNVSQHGTLNLNAASTFGGGLSSIGSGDVRSRWFGATVKLLATNAFTGAHGIDVRYAGRVEIAYPQGYTGGTRIWGAQLADASGGQPVLAVQAGGTLGANVAGNDVMIHGGILELAASGNIGSNQRLVLDSGPQSLATLTIPAAFGGVPAFESGSGGGSLAVATPVAGLGNQSSYGSGRIFLGATGAEVIFPASETFSPGADNTFRLGGGTKGMKILATLPDDNGTHLLVGFSGSGGGAPEGFTLQNTLGITGEAIIRSSMLNVYGSTVPAQGVHDWRLSGGQLKLGGGSTGVIAELTENGTTQFGAIANDAVVHLQNGALAVVAWNKAQPSSEIFGTLAVEKGANTLTLSRPHPSSTLDVTAGQVVHDASGHGTLSIGGIDALSRFIVTNASSLGRVGGTGSRGTDKPVIPWAFALDTYLYPMTSDANGVLAKLNPAVDCISNLTAANADGNDNYYYDYTAVNNDVTVTLTADTSVNSFVARYSNPDKTLTVDPSGKTLGIKSGLLLTQDKALIRMNCAVDFGTSEGFISAKGVSFYNNILAPGGLTLHSGAMDLRAAAPGLSGPLVLNGGTLTVYGDYLPHACDMIMNGGTFKLDGVIGIGSLTVGAGRMITYNNKALVVGDFSQKSNGAITLADGGVLRVSGKRVKPGCDLDVGSFLFGMYGGVDSGASYKMRFLGGEVVMDIVGADAYDTLAFQGANFRTTGKPWAISFGSPGSELKINLGYKPAVGQLYKIIDIEGKIPTVGKFANGDVVKADFENRYRAVFKIHYNSALAGGDGNDVVLECTDVADRRSATVISVR